MKTPFVKIIGAGISGLSCGVSLLEAGFGVTIVSDKDIEHTTSAAAVRVILLDKGGAQDVTRIAKAVFCI